MGNRTAVADEEGPSVLEPPVQVDDGPAGFDAVGRLEDETAMGGGRPAAHRFSLLQAAEPPPRLLRGPGDDVGGRRGSDGERIAMRCDELPDLEGCRDERSDRTYAVTELIDRGYEDAYRQFIEPIVGGSGEGMNAAT